MISDLTDSQGGCEFGSDARVPLRVLVADDDQGVLRVLNHVVRFLGHVVVGTAIDGQECVRRAKQLRPDLVIADLTMPRGDGIGAAAAISRNSKVPIIITTGATDEETLSRLKSADIAGHLAKPFKLEEVKTAIQRAINRGHRLTVATA